MRSGLWDHISAADIADFKNTQHGRSQPRFQVSVFAYLPYRIYLLSLLKACGHRLEDWEPKAENHSNPHNLLAFAILRLPLAKPS